ncbi:hypothetical protein CCP2SC5_160033 [Azospirillaceae bacterium]
MTEPASSQTLHSLTIDLAGEIFAIPVVMVRDILDVLPVTEVPTARPFVNGLINVRGRVAPLVDLRLKLIAARRDHSQHALCGGRNRY